MYNSPAMARELEHLPQQLIPNAPTDDVERHFLTLTKSERAVEVERMTQKLRFLETMEKNEDIKANQYVGEVLIALDMKVKSKETEKAVLKTRQTLGPSPPSREDRPRDTRPQSIWNSIFSPDSNAKRARTDDDTA